MIEDYAPHEPVTTCDDAPKPGVLVFRDWTIHHFGGHTIGKGIARACVDVDGDGDLDPSSKHNEGRALDWHQDDDADAYRLIALLLAPDDDGNPHALARRAGIRTIIFNRDRWYAHDGPFARKPYTGAHSHADHIHFGFSWAGARGQTSFYAAPPTPPGTDDDATPLGGGGARDDGGASAPPPPPVAARAVATIQCAMAELLADPDALAWLKGIL